MAVDDDNKHEDTPPAPPADPPTPPADPPAHHDGDRLGRLEELVTGLVQQVAQLAPVKADETPTSVPWTHRKLS